MTKILEVSEEIHMSIVKKQLEILERHGYKPLMQDISNIAIKYGIRYVEQDILSMLDIIKKKPDKNQQSLVEM